MRSFDSISWYYDQLTFVIFTGKIKRANTAFTEDIVAGQKVLIIGGGSGHILPYLRKGVLVDFVDASSKMLRKARKRNCAAQVDFHHSLFEALVTDQVYDVIICPFFLDLFPENDLEYILDKIEGLCHKNTALWVSDFRYTENPEIRQRIILLGMKFFFRITIRLNFNKISPIQQALEKRKWNVLKARRYYMDMLFSTWYLKM